MALVEKLTRHIRSLSRLFPGRMIFLRGRPKEGLRLLSELLTSSLSEKGESVARFKDRASFVDYFELEADSWQKNFRSSYASNKTTCIIFDECCQDSDLMGVIQALDASMPLPKLVISICDCDHDSVAPSSVGLELSDYRVGPHEMALILDQESPDLGITVPFFESTVISPLPVLLFLSWKTHFSGVLELCERLGLHDSLNPLVAEKSVVFRPKPDDSGAFLRISVLQHHYERLGQFAVKLGRSCTERSQPYYEINNESYSELSLTPQFGRDPLGLAELFVVLGWLGLAYTDGDSCRVYPSSEILRLARNETSGEEMPWILERVLVSSMVDTYALVVDQEHGPRDDVLLPIPARLPGTSWGRALASLEMFFPMENSHQSVIVLESLRLLQENIAPHLEQRPSHFIAQMDPSNSAEFTEIHQGIAWNRMEDLLRLIPASVFFQRKYTAYFGNIYQRVRKSTTTVEDANTMILRVASLGELETFFGTLPEFRQDFTFSIESAMSRMERSLGHYGDGESYRQAITTLVSEYIRMYAKHPEELEGDDLFVWIRSCITLWDKVDCIRNLPLDVSHSTIDRYCEIMNGSIDLLCHSEVFLDTSMQYDSKAHDFILENYGGILSRASLPQVRNVIGWAMGIEDQAPSGMELLSPIIRRWNDIDTNRKAVFLFIVDGFSYRHFLSWQDRNRGSKRERLERVFWKWMPIFAPVPTVTAPGHVTIAAGSSPGEHGVVDTNLYFRSVGPEGGFSYKKVLDSATPDDLGSCKNRLIGTYLRKHAACYLFNRYLKEPPRDGLSSILNHGMKNFHRIESLPELRSELAKLPGAIDRPTFYLVQLPDLDSYSHDEGVYRPGRPQSIMDEQVMSQYDRFFNQFLEIVESMVANAKHSSTSILFVVCADHGMDLCFRGVTSQNEVLERLGLSLLAHAKGVPDTPDFLPMGLYPKKSFKGRVVPSDRVGFVNPRQLTGKFAAIYVLQDTEKMAVVKGTCGCGEFNTVVCGDAGQLYCPDCRVRVREHDRRPFGQLVRELKSDDYDGYSVLTPDRIALDSSSPSNERVYPTLVLVAKPGFYLRPMMNKNDQEQYNKLSKHLKHDAGTPITALLEIEGMTERVISEVVNNFVREGYLRGYRVPGSKTLGSNYSHIVLRRRPLTGTLAHGSMSISESFVPLGLGGWFGDE